MLHFNPFSGYRECEGACEDYFDVQDQVKPESCQRDNDKKSVGRRHDRLINQFFEATEPKVTGFVKFAKLMSISIFFENIFTFFLSAEISKKPVQRRRHLPCLRCREFQKQYGRFMVLRQEKTIGLKT